MKLSARHRHRGGNESRCRAWWVKDVLSCLYLLCVSTAVCVLRGDQGKASLVAFTLSVSIWEHSLKRSNKSNCSSSAYQQCPLKTGHLFGQSCIIFKVRGWSGLSLWYCSQFYSISFLFRARICETRRRDFSREQVRVFRCNFWKIWK